MRTLTMATVLAFLLCLSACCLPAGLDNPRRAPQAGPVYYTNEKTALGYTPGAVNSYHCWP